MKVYLLLITLLGLISCNMKADFSSSNVITLPASSTVTVSGTISE